MDMVSHILDDILVFTFSGNYQRGDEDEILEQYFAAIRANSPKKVLADCRGLVGRQSMADTYFQARDIPPDYYRFTAVVERAEYKNSAVFQDLAFRNAGHYNLKVFFDYDEALGWLREQR